MKFRITRSGRKIISKAQGRKKITFAGRNTLKIIKPLPAVSLKKEITVSNKAIQNSSDIAKRIRINVKNLFGAIYRTLKEIARELCLAYKRLVSFVDKGLRRSRHRADRKRSPFMLMGAASASVLVTLIVSSLIFVGIFADRARGYELITIPSFVGMRPDEAEFDQDKINLIISYENNPDIENGAVISQTPRAGVTRRIYSNGEFCNIHLTVSRHEKIAVPDGIVGSSLRDASLILMNCGLQYEVKEKFSLGSKDGTVLSSYPRSGETVTLGETVILTVSG